MSKSMRRFVEMVVLMVVGAAIGAIVTINMLAFTGKTLNPCPVPPGMVCIPQTALDMQGSIVFGATCGPDYLMLQGN